MKNFNWKPVLLLNQGVYFFILAAFCVLAGLLVHVICGSIFFVFFSVFFFVFFLWLCIFFRNPNRRIPVDDSLILAPADGTVVSVEENVEEEGCSGKVHRTAVFLSLFNVHVNRIPVSGIVTDVEKKSGNFYPAFHSKAGRKNHQKSITIDTAAGMVTVRQIAGIVARRIITDIKIGDKVHMGEIYGMIRFGSRVEIIFPCSVDLLVKEGDKLKAGVSIIGKAKK